MFEQNIVEGSISFQHCCFKYIKSKEKRKMENEFNDNLDFKSLENFLSKDINTFLAPQEMMIMSISLSHVARVLNLYNKMTNVAVFDVKKFVAEHPEYTNMNFDNLDGEETNNIRKLLRLDETDKNEEFNKGDILLNSIIDAILNIGTKLYDSYTKEYDENAPEDTQQFFAMLESCLDSTLSIMQSFFTQQQQL